MTALKTHGHVVLPKNTTYDFFGLNQCILITGTYCENLKKTLCGIFEKIKFKVLAISLHGNGITIQETDQNFELKYLENYTYKLIQIFTVSFSQQDLSISVKKTIGCVFGQTHDHVPLKIVRVFYSILKKQRLLMDQNVTRKVIVRKKVLKFPKKNTSQK